MKYGLRDARDISERSSARETVARVAAGALANAFLRRFEIRVLGYVVEVGGMAGPVPTLPPDDLERTRNGSNFCILDPRMEEVLRGKVDQAREQGDTLGGIFEVQAIGVPPGLGSHASWTVKLDGRLAGALMSVQTVKGVEIGLGFGVTKRPGSQVHDPILPGGQRGSNNAGGIEGGMSNGQAIVVRAACKPISTLRKPLATVDLQSGEPAAAQYERSDVCVVPASVIGQAVVSFELVGAFLEKFGADAFEEVVERFEAYRQRTRQGGDARGS
jgi:chorismate synthase